MKNILLSICCALAMVVLPVSNSWAERPAACRVSVLLSPASNNSAEFEFNTNKPGEKNGYTCVLQDTQNPDYFVMQCSIKNSSVRIESVKDQWNNWSFFSISSSDFDPGKHGTYSYLWASCH